MNGQERDTAANPTPVHQRPDAALVQAAAAFGTATLHEAAGKIGALPSQIKPVVDSFTVCGPALTVHSPGGDNLWLHRAIYRAQPGDVLVAYVSGQYEHGYWGEIMSAAARARGLAGLVIDGCVRDRAILEQFGFPICARGLCIRGTDKEHSATGWINAPILMGDVVVHPGDLIVGDADGVVAIPRALVAQTVAASKQREQNEADIVKSLKEGATSLDLYGWR